MRTVDCIGRQFAYGFERHEYLSFSAHPRESGDPGATSLAFYVYILATKRNGTLYIGMTDDLVKRVWQHHNDLLIGFTHRYGVKTLVWFEHHESRDSAFTRERQLKKWNRSWKLDLIERDNPQWRDLWPEISPP